jgi:monofunctional biosynthetic peptidoglycan transglycosylase
MPPSPAQPPRRWRRRLARAGEIAVMMIAVGTLMVWCSVPNTGALLDDNPTSSAFIDLRRAEAAEAGKPFKLKWEWRPLSHISRYLRAAVVFAEDANFYRHDGVDWHAIETAFEKDLSAGHLSTGGSTITQQVAKNLYLSPSRNPIRKARELLVAYSLEDHLNKQRILELYLNLCEWGDGVFGAEAAAQHWFGRSAQALTPAQAARLAIALPNPILRSPKVQSDELTKKAVRIVRLFRMQGLIGEAQEREAYVELGAADENVLPEK